MNNTIFLVSANEKLRNSFRDIVVQANSTILVKLSSNMDEFYKSSSLYKPSVIFIDCQYFSIQYMEKNTTTIIGFP